MPYVSKLSVSLDVDAKAGLESLRGFGDKGADAIDKLHQSYRQFEQSMRAARGVAEGQRALRDYQSVAAALGRQFGPMSKQIDTAFKLAGKAGKDAFSDWSAGARMTEQYMNQCHAAAIRMDDAMEKARTKSGAGLKEMIAFGGAAGLAMTAANAVLEKTTEAIKAIPEAVVNATKAFLELSDQTEKLALRSGASKDQMERLASASKVAGVDVGGIVQAITRLNAVIGSGKQAKLLDSLGLSRAQLDAADPVSRLRMVIEATEKIGSSTERAYAQRSLLSRSYVNVLEAERKGVFDLMASQYSLGEATLQAGVNTSRAIRQMTADYDFMKAKVGALVVETGLFHAVLYAGVGIFAGVAAAYWKAVSALLSLAEGFGKAAAGAELLRTVTSAPWATGAALEVYRARVASLEAEYGKARKVAEDMGKAQVASAVEYGKRIKALLEEIPKGGPALADAIDLPDSAVEKAAAQLDKLEQRHTEMVMKAEEKALGAAGRIALWWSRAYDIIKKTQLTVGAVVGPKYPTAGPGSFGAGPIPTPANAYGATPGTAPGMIDAVRNAFERAIASGRTLSEATRDVRKRLEEAQVPADEIDRILGKLPKSLSTTKDETIRWQTALEGVAMMAGLIGGNFGESLQVIENIGRQLEQLFKKGTDGMSAWKKMSGSEKIGAAGLMVSQIGGLIGGKAGGLISGMGAGAAMGSAFGPIGAGVGAVVGGLAGLFSAGKKKREEEKRAAEEAKAAYEKLTQSIKDQYGSIEAARVEARNYGIDLKAALDTKDAKALDSALKELQKRIEGMKTAVEGAAGLAGFKAGTPESAAAQGALFASVFWAAVRTQGLVAAAASLAEPFAQMWENASEQVRTFLAPIQQQISLAKNEAFAGAAELAGNLQKVVSGLAAAGVVSINDLQNASVLATDAYSQALAAAEQQGITGAAAQEAAIRAVGPAVLAIIQQYEALGIPLDENLKKLKETAEASGLMFPEEPMDRAADAMERVAVALEKAFGLSTGIADEIGRAADNAGRVRIPGGGEPTEPTEPTETYQQGTGGFRTVKRDMLARVHEGEGIMVVPRPQMVEFSRPALGSEIEAPGAGGGGPQEIRVTIPLDGKVIAEVLLRRNKAGLFRVVN